MRRTILSLALLAVAGQLQAAELLLTIETSGKGADWRTLESTYIGIGVNSFILPQYLETVRMADVGQVFQAPSEAVASIAGPLTDPNDGDVLRYGCCQVGFGEIQNIETNNEGGGGSEAYPYSFRLTRHVPVLGHELFGYTVSSMTATLDELTIAAVPQSTGSTVDGKFTARFYGDAVPIVAGDFNQNGEVDAADYVLWRNRNGTDGSLPNESGKTPLDITQEDYEFWRANFGHGFDPVSSALGLGSQSIPEPATWFMVGSIVLHLFGRRRSRQR